ncbi:Hypothetical protein HVR_LOCUS149 [uncultured virus]|nr:Hypothetical protein HVR_LOCUS149 [uncultured virus]
MSKFLVTYPVKFNGYYSLTTTLHYDIIVPDSLKERYSYGRPWEYEMSRVIEHFDDLKPLNSTVGTKDGNEYRPNVRVSKQISGLEIKQVESLLLFPELKYMYPERYRNEEFEYDIKQKYKKSKFQLHCYESGGFFSEHTDGKKGPRHFATLLIFPPAHISPFEGGDLILKPVNQEVVTISPSQFKDWTVVAFRLDVAHECTPITSGRRFVLKTELDLPYDNLFFSNNKIAAAKVPVNCDEEMLKCLQKLCKYLERVEKYKAKQSFLESGIPTAKIYEMIEEIKNTDGNVCLILDVYATDPCELKGELAMLWNEIITLWPYSSLQIKDTSHNIGDGNGTSYELDLDENRNPSSEIGNSKIFYWKSPGTHTLGQIQNTRSEYNDSTYDTYHDLTVSMICIQKEIHNEPKTDKSEENVRDKLEINESEDEIHDEFSIDDIY